MTIRQTLKFLKYAFKLDMKRAMAYPTSFWLGFIPIPFYPIVQIIFLEIIFSQTNNFVGYTKYEAFVLFGTFKLVQGLAYVLFFNRLTEIKFLIRGDGQESFDTILTKPVDPQLYTTLGRYDIGNIGTVIAGILIVIYGVNNGHIDVHFLNILSYALLTLMGAILLYVIFLVLSTLLFWFDQLDSIESLWDSLQAFGQYPTSLYSGPLGLIFNLVIPITLMAGIPSGILLGKAPLYNFFIYLGVIVALLYLSRQFWKYAIKRYSSSSS